MMQLVDKSEQQIRPTMPGEWTLLQVQTALKRKIPESMLSTKPQGGKSVSYVPWYVINQILDKYAPGWTWEIKQAFVGGDRFYIVGRLTFTCSDGIFYREATGTERLDCSNYGDPSSNAEAMAFRRCASKFGLGLSSYSQR